MGIDRDNSLSWEADGQVAERYMGEIPKDVLVGKRRAAFAPPILSGSDEWLPPVFESEEEIEGFEL